ncbi:hypothetical protein [Chryseolinea soli]|uniref:Lipoprotein n=1 Tax=Chryseolinea soli TaxID=2321403 RepID=A0A385SZH2_9BACT|nr:hypothetical protein [Chryseolinea soli]AYB34158.1 hypothetical protein D4L85_27825 [Chryseolinea soli]
MKNYSVILFVALFAGACAMTRKYQDPQHAIYARMLTPDEKNEINRTGEITKNIELYDPMDKNLWHGMLKGTLRILKTENPEVFNFVEIGIWVTLTRPKGQITTNYRVKDSTENDRQGNTLSKVRYYEGQAETYYLEKKCTSKMIDQQFIQHVEVFMDTALVMEYNMRVLDYGTPKSDSQKQKIVVGMYNEYFKGKLVRTKVYDNDGNLILESKASE